MYVYFDFDFDSENTKDLIIPLGDSFKFHRIIWAMQSDTKKVYFHTKQTIAAC